MGSRATEHDTSFQPASGLYPFSRWQSGQARTIEPGYWSEAVICRICARSAGVKSRSRAQHRQGPSGRLLTVIMCQG